MLAPEAAFSPDTAPLDNGGTTADQLIWACLLIEDGYPASALAVLKATRRDGEVMRQMRRAHLALGRETHAARADIWLDLSGE